MLCCHEKKIPDKIVLKKKGLFWFTVLEMSVHVSCSLVSDAVMRTHFITEDGKADGKGLGKL